MELKISLMTSVDWPSVSAIYQAGIDSGNATFATQPPASWDEWTKSKLNHCNLVAKVDKSVIGWAALSPTSDRCVYRGVAEVSIYIDPSAHGNGVGSSLMQALIETSEAHDIWTLQAGIFPENTASMQLHLKHGFKLIGIREKPGYMSFGPYKDQWRDVAFLERRSKITGI